MSSFTLFSVVESFMSSGPDKVVVTSETLLIIAETDALEIPKASCSIPMALWH